MNQEVKNKKILFADLDDTLIKTKSGEDYMDVDDFVELINLED